MFRLKSALVLALVAALLLFSSLLTSGLADNGLITALEINTSASQAETLTTQAAGSVAAALWARWSQTEPTSTFSATTTCLHAAIRPSPVKTFPSQD